jgi:hypothetical protein
MSTGWSPESLSSPGTNRRAPMTDIQARHAPAVLAGQLEIATRWGQPDLGYVLLFRPDPAASAELGRLQQLVLEAEPSLLRQPAAQLHASVAWLLQVRKEFDRPKDEIWRAHGEQWVKTMAAVTDATAAMQLRYHRLVVTDAAIIAVAEEPNPMADLRHQITTALDLPWPITYSSLGIVHSSLLRYRQPLADPAGLLRRLAAIPVDVETEVTELLMVREYTFPTLDYEVLQRLPLGGRPGEPG